MKSKNKYKQDSSKIIEAIKWEISEENERINDLDYLIQQGLKKDKGFQETKKGEDIIREIHKLQTKVSSLEAEMELKMIE